MGFVSEDPFEMAITPASEGLRERKKRLTRELISETATEMFLTRGFDEVKVSEVAAACGISEKTVYNYFPNKESLMLDREEETTEAIRQALGSQSAHQSPVDAMLSVLSRQRHELCSYMEQTQPDSGMNMFLRFNDLLATTPSLRAAHWEMMERFTEAATDALAERAGVSVDDPEQRMAAGALISLLTVQYRSLRRHASASRPKDIYIKVTDEVERAAQLINSGLQNLTF